MDKSAITIRVEPMIGEPITMHLVPLDTRTYFSVVHEAFTVMMSSIKAKKGKAQVSFSSALAALDFDRFEAIASALLTGAVVEGVGAITNVFDSDFFRKRTDALYFATFEALKAQCPDLFLALSRQLGNDDSGRLEAQEDDQ